MLTMILVVITGLPYCCYQYLEQSALTGHVRTLYKPYVRLDQIAHVHIIGAAQA